MPLDTQVRRSTPRGADQKRSAGAPSAARPATGSPVALSTADFARLRQAIYKLLGGLFLYPNEDRLARLLAGAAELQEVAELWRGAAFAAPLERMLAALVPDGTGRTPLQQLEEEYMRLFQLKPAAPPYESFYLDPEGQARAWIASGLEGAYSEAGLAPSEDLNDMPDHVAVEFEFMSYLCGVEAAGREGGSDEDADQAHGRQRAFLGAHLGRWFPRFAQLTAKAKPKDPYGVVCQTAYGFLFHDLDFLGLRPPEAGARPEN